MTLRVFARPDLQHLCKVSVFVQEHTNHGADAVLPQHRRQRTLSEDCKSTVAQAVCFGLAPGEIQLRNFKRVETLWQQQHGGDAEGPQVRPVLTLLSRSTLDSNA
jgi:hypothetical protein